MKQSDEEQVQTDEKYHLSNLFIEEKIVSEDNLRKNLHKQDSKAIMKQSDEEQKDPKKWKESFKCKICGGVTTYQDFSKHRIIEQHKRGLVEWKRKKRQEKKLQENKEQKAKQEENQEKITTGFALPFHVRNEISPAPNEIEKEIKDIYYIRRGDSLPELHRLYIVTLTTLLSLRCCFSKKNRNFQVSIINDFWKEFGDIVIEFDDNKDIVEIQAIQCKQIQNKSKICLSTLGAEMGKFSIKTRCDILRKLNQKKHFNKTNFNLFTVSSLAVSKDVLPQFVYDDQALEDWKKPDEKNEWRNKRLIFPEYSYTSFVNTTDDPDDIYIVKIVDEENQLMTVNLNKFSIFTNQSTLEGLKRLIKLTLRNRFEKCKDITSDLINYVDDHFKPNQEKSRNKLAKNKFLFKLSELLLKPFETYAENASDNRQLKLWNDAINIFDVIVIKNQVDLVKKIYSSLNYIILKEIKCSTHGKELNIERRQIINQTLSSIIFEECDGDCRTFSPPQVYVALWKAKLAPLVLSTNNEEDLSLIIKIISLLHEENFGLKFIILTHLQIDRSLFPENLKAFLTLKDLDDIKNNRVLEELRETLVVKCFNFSIYLREILKYNEHFLENNTPDALLNMLLEDYSFNSSSVGRSHDVFGNTLVLSDADIQKIERHLKNEEEKRSESLSYVVNVKGNPVHVEVPPEL